MKSILLLVLTLTSIELISQTTLQGTILDHDTQEAIVFANVSLYRGGELIFETTTDLEGFYSMTEIDPEEYQVLFQRIAYNECLYHGLRITSGNISTLNGALSSGTGLERYDIFLPEASQLFQRVGASSGRFFAPNEISKLPFR